MDFNELEARIDSVIRSHSIPRPERFHVVHEQRWPELCPTTGAAHQTVTTLCYDCSTLFFPISRMTQITPDLLNTIMKDAMAFINRKDQAAGLKH